MDGYHQLGFREGSRVVGYVFLGEEVDGSSREGDVLKVQTEPDSPGTGGAVEGVEGWMRGGGWLSCHFCCFGL